MIQPGDKVIDFSSPKTGVVAAIESKKKLVIIKWHNCNKSLSKFSDLYSDIGAGILYLKKRAGIDNKDHI